MGENTSGHNNPLFLRRKSVFTIVFICSLIAACEFNPTGTSHHIVQIPDADIDLVILDSANINYLRGPVEIAFEPILNGKTFIKAELYIDSSLHPVSGWESFSVNTADYPDGEHTLRFFLYTSTNSGSLADRLGAEVFIVEKDYQAYFFNQPIEPISITKIVDTLGTVKISWERYNGPAFENYVVIRSDKVHAEITDQDQTTFYDNKFLAGYGTYYIALNVAGEEIMGYGAAHQAGVPRFNSAELVDDSLKIKLTWERCNYDSALSYYQITRRSSFGDGKDTLFEIYNIDQTSYTDNNPPIGGCRYYLRIIPKQGDPPAANSSIWPPAPGKSFQCKINAYFEYIGATNRIFNIWPENYSSLHLFLYDAASLSQITQRTYNTVWIYYYNRALADVSNNGQFGYVIQKSTSGKVSRFNTSDLYSIFDFDLADYYPGTWSQTYEISVSDNNRIAVAGNANFDGYMLALFDMNTRVLKGYTSTDNPTDMVNLQISSSGDYIININKVYQLNGDTLIALADVSDNARFKGNSDSYIEQIGASLRVVRLPDLSIISDVQLNPDALFSDYDPMTGLAGCDSKNEGYYYIVDINTGEIKKTIPISKNGFRFQNGTLFTGYAYVDLNL